MALEWIDATDSLPTEEGDYIVRLSYEVTVLHYDDVSGWFSSVYSESYDDEDILSWIPLPPLPTEEK